MKIWKYLWVFPRYMSNVIKIHVLIIFYLHTRECEIFVWIKNRICFSLSAFPLSLSLTFSFFFLFCPSKLELESRPLQWPHITEPDMWNGMWNIIAYSKWTVAISPSVLTNRERLSRMMIMNKIEKKNTKSLFFFIQIGLQCACMRMCVCACVQHVALALASILDRKTHLY